MITPREIKDKAIRKYPAFLRAWLSGEDFFPLPIPAKMAPSRTEWNTLRRWMEELSQQSKLHRKWGYEIEFGDPVRTRTHGEQSLPRSIVVPTREDLLQITGKKAEFDQFRADVGLIREHMPALEGWMRRRAGAVVEQAGHWADLLKVCRYFLENPRPGRYARELPLTVHSKFVEQHRGILRELLNELLPETAIEGEASDFEARFGLKTPPLTVRFRLLDPALKQRFGLPATDLSLPMEDFAALPFGGLTVVVSENLMPFLTLPERRESLAVFGEGNAVAALQADWMRDSPIIYWGDLDIQGFRFLAQLRGRFPQTRSIFMDEETLERYRQFAVAGVEDRIPEPAVLCPEELAAFRTLRGENIRIEQERIHQSEVCSRLAREEA